jgi:NTE family protein
MFSDKPHRSKLPYFEKIDNHKYQFNIGISEYNKPEKLGLIEGQTIENTFARLIPDFTTEKDFDKLKIPYRCISVDILSGNEVVHSGGSLSQAMRATMSVPSAFTPVEFGDSLLIDGGVLNNMPVDIVRDMGADFVIAVAVRNPNKDKKELGGFLEILMQAYNIIGLEQIHKQAELSDVYIECLIENLSPMDFTSEKAQEIINEGRRYANHNIDKLLAIKKMLEPYEKSPETAKYFTFDSITVHNNLSYKDENIINLLDLQPNMTTEKLVEELNNIKDTLQLKEIKYSIKHTPQYRDHLSITIKESAPKIFGLYIKGNKIHSFGFIYRLIGIKPGTKLDIELLENRINYLYSLGYFKKITYDMDYAIPGFVKLNINVHENPRRKIRFGLRYDNQYDLVAAISGQFNNAIIPGLRLEDEIQLLGYTMLSGKIYYPSRTLSIPIYPFLEIKYKNEPKIIYFSDGSKLASYNYVTFQTNAGLGLLYKNFEHLQSSFYHEIVEAKPEIAEQFSGDFQDYRDQISGIQIEYTLDLLDDYLYPKKGIYIKGNFEKAYKAFFNSDREYMRYELSMDFYATSSDRLTFHLNGFYSNSNNAPEYKYFWIGGPESFIGLEYDQLITKEMFYLKPEINVELMDNFRWSMIYNYALDYEPIFSESEFGYNEKLSAWGTGIEINSAVGPLKFIIAKSVQSITNELNNKFYFYFTAGYAF